jgi:hypothetical protein
MVAEDILEPVEPGTQPARKKSGKSGNETAGKKLLDEVARGEGMNTPLASADAGGVSAWRGVRETALPQEAQ